MAQARPDAHFATAPRQLAGPVARAYAPPRARPLYHEPAPPQPEPLPGRGLRVDGLALAALIIAVFFVFQSFRDRSGHGGPPAAPAGAGQTEAAGQPAAQEDTVSAPEPVEAQAPEAQPPAEVVAVADPWAISYPYDEYWLTQGPHGYSYGHMAIDLAAGKGEAVKSPIHGQVTAVYVDEYGNTTLVIENDVYTVTLLHGNYTVQVGQQVALGEVVGSEWNHGYTLDFEGRSCRGRDCGYHTHLNVYSKVNQSNVNPLDVLR